MTLPLDDDACYQALLSRDARLDGCFFTAVTSTGIYCRPVCRVRAPLRRNCRFFAYAAQAEAAGFRPCMRCRPELAPQALGWSIQDASHTLALQAARLLDAADCAALPSMAELAGRLGVSARHVRRIFQAHLGVSPLQYLQTRRLLCAKQLLTDTGLSMAAVASASGFASLRRFNAAFVAHYRMNPSRLRSAGQDALGSADESTPVAVGKDTLTSLPAIAPSANPDQAIRSTGTARTARSNQANQATQASQATQAPQFTQASQPTQTPQFTTVRLGYRPPYNIAAMLQFLQTRQLNTIETIANYAIHTPANPLFIAPDLSIPAPHLLRTLRLPHGAHTLTGWVAARFVPARCTLEMTLSDSLRPALPLLIRRMRAALDLDADPQAIEAVLGQRLPGLPGLPNLPDLPDLPNLGKGLPEVFAVSKDLPEAHAPSKDFSGIRIPGCLDGFELAVRAILGQQVTVAAGRTFAQRLADTFGEAIATPFPGLTMLFPTAAALAQADPAALGALGIVRQRQSAIIALAQAVCSGALDLNSPVASERTIDQLKALPGIGDWTAHYIAMRTLRWPDAFPAGDVALHHALGLRNVPGYTAKNASLAAQALSQAWRPWRSYAVLRAWASLPAPPVQRVQPKQPVQPEQPVQSKRMNPPSATGLATVLQLTKPAQ